MFSKSCILFLALYWAFYGVEAQAPSDPTTLLPPMITTELPAGVTTVAAAGASTAASTVASSSTTTDVLCVDVTSDCVGNNGLCNNANYRALMRQKCPRTCGYCGAVVGTCTDNSPACANWARNGICMNSFYPASLKRVRCARTCNLCDGDASCSGCTDDARCAGWKAVGFCQNTLYTQSQKQRLCPNACCLCNSGK